ncbi:GNAT family N-acetyltransferase [Aurantimonas sp. A3-2-R12]|uniref:GNAT family N-acetyltransferase n=1 Tax=Aurantimonas sp. A3-2-R12 TaxID=3114362 RepID=UPI002E18F97B|nr:GNAT family N-acetyltransferase [Aurantimonas sp. A3-2-R12]
MIMDIRHEADGTKGRFTTGEGDSEMTYVRVGETLVIFDHTFVPDRYRGQGLAGKLLAAGVDWARAENLKVIPQCPFARTEFDRKPEYRDVLKE